MQWLWQVLNDGIMITFKHILFIALFLAMVPSGIVLGQSGRLWNGFVLQFEVEPQFEIPELDAKGITERHLLQLNDMFDHSIPFINWASELNGLFQEKRIPHFAINSLVENLFINEPEYVRELFKFSILKQWGYSACLFQDGGMVFVGVYSKGHFPGRNYFLVGRRRFYVLNDHGRQFSNASPIILSQNSRRCSFSFLLDQLPIFDSPLIHCDSIEFTYRLDSIEPTNRIQYCVNLSMIDLLEQTSVPMNWDIGRVPISGILEETLFESLREELSKRSVVESLNYLLALCANGITYSEDMDIYGKEDVPILPEQTMLSKVADCEDLAFLFAKLVHDILGLRVIFVVLPDHLAVGVDLENDIGKVIKYRGRSYTFCDPTGTSIASYIAGEMDGSFKMQKYSITYPKWK